MAKNKANFGNLLGKISIPSEEEIKESDKMLQDSVKNILPKREEGIKDASDNIRTVLEFTKKPDTDLIGTNKKNFVVHEKIHDSMKKAANVLDISISDLYANVLMDFILNYKEEINKIDKRNAKDSLI